MGTVWLWIGENKTCQIVVFWLNSDVLIFLRWEDYGVSGWKQMEDRH